MAETQTPSSSTDAGPMPWSIGVTLALSGAAFLVFLAMGTGLSVALALFGPSALTPGNMFALGGTVGGIAWLSTVGFAALKPGITIKQYLHLSAPRAAATVVYSIIFFVIIGVMEIIRVRSGSDVVPRSVVEAWDTCNPRLMPMLVFGVVVMAPLGEEVMFRGFMLEGLRHSKMGALGAILITSALWAVMHWDYGWYDISSIFAMGLILSYIRLELNSLWVPIGLHVLNNAVALAQTYAYLEGNAGL